MWSATIRAAVLAGMPLARRLLPWVPHQLRHRYPRARSPSARHGRFTGHRLAVLDASWRGAAAGDTRVARARAGRNLQVDAHLMMPKRPRLTATQRRALAILADSGLNGSTVDRLVAGGFKVVTIARLVRNGFVSALPQRMRAGGETVAVMEVHITHAGRWALTGLLDRGPT